MDETWLYHYDPETKQQSMEWRYSGSPRPKHSECKNQVEIFSAQFLGSKRQRYPPRWLSSTGPNYQRGVLFKSAVAIEGLVKEKRGGNVTKFVLVLHDNSPSHRVFATQNKLAYLGFQCLNQPTLFSVCGSFGPVPRREKIWKLANFIPTWNSLLPRRLGWMEKFLNFF